MPRPVACRLRAQRTPLYGTASWVRQTSSARTVPAKIVANEIIGEAAGQMQLSRNDGRTPLSRGRATTYVQRGRRARPAPASQARECAGGTEGAAPAAGARGVSFAP